MQIICLQTYHSPCGELILASLGNELCLCDWHGMPCAERNLERIKRSLLADFRIDDSPVLERARRQLGEYFAGKRKVFEIPLRPVGTDFQFQFWNTLQKIPYGETRTYREIAQAIGNPKGVRAVAQAIGANGIDILIPCHRVIGNNQSLTGYTGGLDKKRFLLGLEVILAKKGCLNYSQ